MVNLPVEEGQQAEALDQNNSASGTTSGTVPGIASGTRAEYTEPTSILELEIQARCVAHRMSVYMDADNHYEFAVKWLREYYNLSFKMLCPKCQSPHDYDELDAPER